MLINWERHINVDMMELSIRKCSGKIYVGVSDVMVSKFSAMGKTSGQRTLDFVVS